MKQFKNSKIRQYDKRDNSFINPTVKLLEPEKTMIDDFPVEKSRKPGAGIRNNNLSQSIDKILKGDQKNSSYNHFRKSQVRQS